MTKSDSLGISVVDTFTTENPKDPKKYQHELSKMNAIIG
jgi:hypothetical protein